MSKLTPPAPFKTGRHSFKERPRKSGANAPTSLLPNGRALRGSQKGPSKTGLNSYTPPTHSEEELKTLSASLETVHLSRKRLLNESRCKLLCTSWAKIGKTGHSGIGSMIFRRIFTLAPEIQAMFPFSDVPTEQLEYNSIFNKHADNFVKILDLAVMNLERLDEALAPKLFLYGIHHAKLGVTGFKMGYWDTFAEALTDSFMEWTGMGAGGHQRETIRAWNILVSYIVDKMRFGFETQKRKQRLNADSPFSSSSPLNRSRASSFTCAQRPSPRN